MNILYLHGYKAKFDIDSPKNKILSQIGKVHGFDIDYDKPYEDIESDFLKKMGENKIDLLVGTSMGGYLANRLGTEYGVPFVMINPVIDPRAVLEKYNHSPEIVESYKCKAIIHPCGLLLLDRGDTVIPIGPTLEYFNDFYETHIFEGGDHRFQHMEDSLIKIIFFYNNSITGFGLNEN
jgi:predicted esterase YcpF (UPF0227 family)